MIANITRECKYIDTVIEEGVLRRLRTLADGRERYNTGKKYALKTVLDDYFSELRGIFWLMGREVCGQYWRVVHFPKM